MTGFLNHRAFHKRLADESERANRDKRPLVVALMDIDNFRFLNDAYGHTTGDEVLSQVAASGEPIILRRAGEDLAAVIPLEHLEFLRDALAMREAEKIARKIDWEQARKSSPPQQWFDAEEPRPF